MLSLVCLLLEVKSATAWTAHNLAGSTKILSSLCIRGLMSTLLLTNTTPRSYTRLLSCNDNNTSNNTPTPTTTKMSVKGYLREKLDQAEHEKRQLEYDLYVLKQNQNQNAAAQNQSTIAKWRVQAYSIR